MADSYQIAVLSGGELNVHAEGEKSKEAVLALPLSRLIVKIIRVPSASREDAAGYLAPLMQAISPYPDEPLTVSFEKIREDAEGDVVLAAAMPESSADDIGEQLDAKGLNITRVDATVLGQLRMLWPQLSAGPGAARRLLFIGGADCVSLFVIDGDAPSAVRALPTGADMKRETILTLMEAEDFGGAREVAEVVVAGEVEGADALAEFGPLRRIAEVPDGIAGLVERSRDGSTFDALPESWREMLNETRFKAKMKGNLIVAGAIWLLLVGVIFGYPMTFDFLADRQKALCREKAHARQYREAKDLSDKLNLIHGSGNHERGVLELMRYIATVQPSSIKLSNWKMKENGVTFSGEASGADLDTLNKDVFAFKQQLLKVNVVSPYDDEEKGPLFAYIAPPVTTQTKSGGLKFTFNCLYEAPKEGSS